MLLHTLRLETLLSLCKTWIVLKCTELTKFLCEHQWLTNSPVLLYSFCSIFEDAPLTDGCHVRTSRWHLWFFIFRISWRILCKRDVSPLSSNRLQVLWADFHVFYCNFHRFHTRSVWMLVAFFNFFFQLMIALLVFCGRCSPKSRSSLVKEWLHRIHLAWFVFFCNDILIQVLIF